MKCNFAGHYIEMSLSDFIRLYPDVKGYLPRDIDVTDTEYQVRFSPFGDIEIGYFSDAWTIN